MAMHIGGITLHTDEQGTITKAGEQWLMDHNQGRSAMADRGRPTKMRKICSVDGATALNIIKGLNPNVNQDLRYRIVKGEPVLELWREA